MLFNSAEFLLFFPITVFIYYILPFRFRYIWLLIASYYFYMQWNAKYAFLLLTSTAVTYVGARVLERTELIYKRRICLVVVLVINLSMLGFFKYSNMFVGYINIISHKLGRNEFAWDTGIVLPVGISFFTLQALGYLIDVYRREIYAEHNFLKYALFVSFFPQLVAGPIERSKNLLKQLATPQKYSYENMRRGLMIMLYGYFLKVVIADRIAIIVDTVYNDSSSYAGWYIVVATICFAIQIYCDFYGYSTIAKGAALTMGITLMDNFNAPYFSKSIKEFWRRWHISLSTWFRDYLYIPLGGNRKGLIRKNINLLIVFGVSGLWHGASLSFVIWGLLHGLYQIAESLFGRVIQRLRIHYTGPSGSKPFSNRLIKWFVTFTLVCFAWLFFRANSFGKALDILTQMFTYSNNWPVLFDQSLYELGVERGYINVLVISIIVLGIVDYQKYRGKNVVELFFMQNWWFRTITVTGLLLVILLFGCYGSAYDVQQFIYFQF